MKKTIVILLILGMLLSLFACGKDAKTDVDTSASASNTSVNESNNIASPNSDSGNGSFADQGTNTQATGEPQYGGTLHITVSSEGASPIGVPWEVYGVEIALSSPFIETLLYQKPSGELIPLLAKSWEEDQDNLEVRMTLNEGILFHDGTELTAEVAVWNLTKSWEHGANMPTTVKAIEVRGDYEFAVLYDEWQFTYASGLGARGNGFISMEAYEKNGLEWARENPVGTGPFVFSEYVKSGYIRSVRNDNYWKEGLPYLDGMDIEFIRDTMTQNIALQSTGEQRLDSIDTTNLEQAQMFQSLGYNVLVQPISALSLIPSSANEDSPFADPDVRLALSYALDRDAICAARGFNLLQPAYQVCSSDYNAYLPESDNLPGYNPEKAKELLAQAGYPNGFSTTLYGQPGMADKDVVVAVQGQLAAVGINAAVEFPDSGGYTAVRGGGWDGMLVQSYRSFAFMASTFSLINSQNSTTYHSLEKPDELEALIQTALRTADDGQAVQAAHRYILQSALVIPIFYLIECTINKPYVEKTEIADLAPRVQPEYVWFSGDEWK